jgi:hypothetical protein
VRVARYDRKIRGCKAKVTSSTSRKDRLAAIFHVLAVTFKQIVEIALGSFQGAGAGFLVQNATVNYVVRTVAEELAVARRVALRPACGNHAGSGRSEAERRGIGADGRLFHLLHQ